MKLLFENWRKFTKDQYYYYGDTQTNIKSIIEKGRIPADTNNFVSCFLDNVSVQEIVLNVETRLRENNIDDIPAVIRFRTDITPSRSARNQVFWDIPDSHFAGINIKDIDVAQIQSKQIISEGLSIQEVDFDFSTLELKKELNPKIWDGDQLRPEVSQKLMEIANDFWDGLGLKDVDIVDIIITGSIANYNWTDMSDIDLHILVNFDDVDENTDLVEAFFRNVRANWNKTHNIMIKGHEVETYIQEASEPHISSGTYSLLNDEWVQKPTYEEVVIDEPQVSRKADCLIDLINKVENQYNRGNYPEAYDEAIRIRNKIRNFRKCGLETGGEFSPENLAFKVLRRKGYLGKLSKIRQDAYDHMMSLNCGCDKKDIRIKIG